MSTFAIVNMFSQPLSTTLSTTNHPLLYNHYIYASPSHVDRSEERERKSAVCVQEVNVQRSVVSATVRESASADLREKSVRVKHWFLWVVLG